VNINASLFIQWIPFIMLAVFTAKFIWPPITKALDERAAKIADGLAAADRAKAELANANTRVEQQLATARTDAAKRLADAERLAQQIVEHAQAPVPTRKAPRSSLRRRLMRRLSRCVHATCCAIRWRVWPSRARKPSSSAKWTQAPTPSCCRG
jgi:hypothetical protein